MRYHLPLLGALALAACAAPRPPSPAVSVSVAAVPSSPPVEPPSPPAVPAPGPGARVPADEHAHGAMVTSRWAPYAGDTARRIGLDQTRVLEALFPDGAPSPVDPSTPLPATISSNAHITGEWTYFESATVLVYEVAPIALPEGRGAVVLYSRALPGLMTHDVWDAEWRLALFAVEGARLLSDAPFRTRIPHHAVGLWDMIYADLAVDGDVKVTITYVHTGSGGGRDQTFEARFRMESAPPRLVLRGVRQTVDQHD